MFSPILASLAMLGHHPSLKLFCNHSFFSRTVELDCMVPWVEINHCIFWSLCHVWTTIVQKLHWGWGSYVLCRSMNTLLCYAVCISSSLNRVLFNMVTESKYGQNSAQVLPGTTMYNSRPTFYALPYKLGIDNILVLLCRYSLVPRPRPAFCRFFVRMQGEPGNEANVATCPNISLLRQYICVMYLSMSYSTTLCMGFSGGRWRFALLNCLTIWNTHPLTKGGTLECTFLTLNSTSTLATPTRNIPEASKIWIYFYIPDTQHGVCTPNNQGCFKGQYLSSSLLQSVIKPCLPHLDPEHCTATAWPPYRPRCSMICQHCKSCEFSCVFPDHRGLSF